MDSKLIYPAYIIEENGEFEVYFPTLFPDYGWEYPLSRGSSVPVAINQAKKDLALSLAGFLHDNEEIPEPIAIDLQHFPEKAKLLEIETSLEQYAEEIQQHLKGRHWHIGYYVEDTEEYIEAIGFKNDEGLWDIYFHESCGEGSEAVILFTFAL